MHKIIVCYLTLFILGIIIAYLSTEKTVVINTPKYNFSANDYIGKFSYLKFTLPGSYWVDSISYNIIGAEKNSLHHMVLQNQSRKDLTCQEKIGERIHAVGKEFTPLTLPKGFAYPIRSSDNLTLLLHLINPTDFKRSDVSMQAILKVRPKVAFWQKTKPVQPIWLDIVNCSIDPSIFIEPNTSQEFKLSELVKVPYNSKIVFAGGHYHNYGQELEIITPNNVYQFKPFPDSSNIEKIDTLIFNQNFPRLQKGDKINLFIKYDNPTSEIIDGMGIGMLYISED